jgi:hypothetical protein
VVPAARGYQRDGSGILARGYPARGGRLAEAHERRAAYLLHETGRTLLSVFVVPISGRGGRLAGDRVSYQGHEYVTSAQT